MNTKKVAIAIVTCFLLLTIKNSKADSIYVYGLANRQTGMIDETVTKSLKKYILDTIGQKHTVIFDENRFENPLKKEDVLLNTGGYTGVNWIIFFGHGSSSSGDIKNAGNYFYPLTNLMYNSSWNSIKGVLIFSCAVLDIGDFGWYKTKVGENSDCDDMGLYEGYCGNYCGIYYNYDEKLCMDDPDPGLKWEELARRKNIQYILGFNSSVPSLESGGAAMTKKFFLNWITLEKEYPQQENFLEAWKKSLMYSKEETPNANIIERSYLKREKDGTYIYGIGRANSESTNGELDWLNLWYPPWEPVKGVSLPISIDSFYNIRYKKCNFSDVKRKDNPILYFSLINLCIRGIVSKISDERKQFYPTNEITIQEAAKMIVNAAGVKKYTSEPENFKCDSKNGGNCEYIKYLFANKIIESEMKVIIPLLLTGPKEINPKDEIDMGKFTKMVIKAFFQCSPEKIYDCSSITTTGRNKDWPCQYFLEAKDYNLLFLQEDQGLFGISDGKIDPSHKVKRGEAAILIDRARILKETGGTPCPTE